jgi:uncharacterized protein (TIGR02646 family)
MRAIRKGAEPPSLAQHRCTAHTDYENYAHKDTLRQHLVTEQRGLCCYCMSRIEADDDHMKIEHWHCQRSYPQEQLNYGNLLGSCLGSKGQPRKKQTCDTRKGDLDLKWNPADPTHQIETRVRYQLDGTVRSDDEAFNAQLNEVLNLNIQFLKNNRKSVLDAVIVWWKREKKRGQGPVSRDRMERIRDKYIAGTGVLEPYCQVAVWWLAQKLARMAT